MPQTVNHYANTADVLSPSLLRDIQKHWHGGYLWITAPGRQNRRKIAQAAIHAGMPVGEVSTLSGLSRRRVYQLAKQIKGGSP